MSRTSAEVSNNFRRYFRKSRQCLVFVLAAGYSSCQFYTTNQELNADFISKDKSPVTLISPPNKSAMDKLPTFSWTKRSGVIRYRLTLSATADFSKIVLETKVRTPSYVVNNADLIGLTQLDAFSYYWRITAEYSDLEISSDSAVFHLMDEKNNYVDGSTATTDQIGNKSFPYKTVQAAIENAVIRRIDSTTPMNVRIAKGTYVEALTLRPGVSLRGGYEASLWTRDIQQNISTLAAPTDCAIIGDSTITGSFTNTTLIEGFTIKGGLIGSANCAFDLVSSSPQITNNIIIASNGTLSTTNTAIRVNGLGASPLISGNTISGGTDTLGSNTGIVAGSGSTPTITNNVISGGLSNAVGILTGGSAAPIITYNTITGYTGALAVSGTGISNGVATPIIIGNNILGGTASGTGILNSGGTTATIANNLIFGGTGTSRGIDNQTSTATIVNNTIGGGLGAGSFAISMQFGATTSISNNIIFNLTNAGASVGTCISEAAAGNNPTAVQNNNFVGCTTFYADSTLGNLNFVCPATGNLHSAAACGGSASNTPTASGNTNITNAGNQLFVNINGADGLLNTLADNDWHLTTNGSICDVRGGGLSLTGVTLIDRDGLSRTTGNPSGGCAPANVASTGWSMGAYESN